MGVFKDFFNSEKVSGFVLIFCTIISLLIANSGVGEAYLHLIHSHLDLSFAGLNLDYSLEHWINDGLMAIFFLMVGLEIERELYIGELSNIRQAALPILAAIGGMLVPAGIHFFFNGGTATQSGFGIPMATDIAFALGILSLAGRRVPVSLKIFLTALAIIDDLGAITVIAIFYTSDFRLYFFLGAMTVFLILYIMGRRGVNHVWIYLAGGLVMWYLMLQSGIHATIAGVLLAFAIPFRTEDKTNISFRLQHRLHYPVAFFILPLFALANTAIVIPDNAMEGLTSNNSMGITLGLIVGKFIGILVFSWLAVKTGLAQLSADVSWRMLAGAAFLGGIGFTMSIFITNLAFADGSVITASKIAILISSFFAASLGLLILITMRKQFAASPSKI